MKARGIWACAALAVAAACLAPAGATAAKPGPVVSDGDRPELTLASFNLTGANGYEIEVVEVQGGGFPPSTQLSVEQGLASASYSVPGELGTGIRASFGELGGAELRFDRRKRRVETIEKGCRWILERGTFRGQLSFTGEGAYTAAEATAVEGAVVHMPHGFCGFGDDRRSRPLFPFLRADRLTATSALTNGSVRLSAESMRGDVRFTASVQETVGAMKIERRVITGGGDRTFRFGDGRRPRWAEVAPPAPFLGTARFERGASVPWTGTLSAPFPGAPNVPLAGTGFTVQLCLDVPLLGRCGRSEVGHTRRPALAQISGSQSQLFGDARLSWAR